MVQIHWRSSLGPSQVIAPQGEDAASLILANDATTRMIDKIESMNPILPKEKLKARGTSTARRANHETISKYTPREFC